MRSYTLWPLALTALLSARQVTAQEQITFGFYHGRGGQSRATVDDADRKLENQHLHFPRVLLPGSEVCVNVRNAHPTNYKYSLDAIVDTTEPPLPDLSKVTAFLTGISANATKSSVAANKLKGWLDSTQTMAFDVRPAVPAEVALPVSVTDYISALKTLSADIARADSAATASDLPGPPDGSDPGKAGFGYGQNVIGGLGTGKFQFHDPKLKDNLAELYRKAKDAANTPESRILADALGGYGDFLLATRDRLKAGYSPDISASPRLCKAVVNGKNTIRLYVVKTVESGKRDVTGAAGKDPQYFTVDVQSRFQRKILSIDPLSLGVLTWSVPRFSIDGDTVAVSRENSTIARPGVMLSLNPKNWGLADDWGLGLGIGLGLGTSDIVTDFLMGVTVSYRSSIRLGVGYGRSSQPNSVRGVKVGQKLPANFGKLEDAVQSGNLGKDAVYFLIALPGLSLKSK